MWNRVACVNVLDTWSDHPRVSVITCSEQAWLPRYRTCTRRGYWYDAFSPVERAVEFSEKRPGSPTTDRRSNSTIIRAAGTIVNRSLLSTYVRQLWCGFLWLNNEPFVSWMSILYCTQMENLFNFALNADGEGDNSHQAKWRIIRTNIYSMLSFIVVIYLSIPLFVLIITVYREISDLYRIADLNRCIHLCFALKRMSMNGCRWNEQEIIKNLTIECRTSNRCKKYRW